MNQACCHMQENILNAMTQNVYRYVFIYYEKQTIKARKKYFRNLTLSNSLSWLVFLVEINRTFPKFRSRSQKQFEDLGIFYR